MCVVVTGNSIRAAKLIRDTRTRLDQTPAIPESKRCCLSCCGGASTMAGITVAMFLLGGIIYASVKLQNWQAPPGVTVREDASIPRRPRVRPITDDELPL